MQRTSVCSVCSVTLVCSVCNVPRVCSVCSVTLVCSVYGERILRAVVTMPQQEETSQVFDDFVKTTIELKLKITEGNKCQRFANMIRVANDGVIRSMKCRSRNRIWTVGIS